MYHIVFIHSSISGHLGSFHVLAIVNSAAMSIGVHVSFRTMFFSWYICPGVGLLDQGSIFNQHRYLGYLVYATYCSSVGIKSVMYVKRYDNLPEDVRNMKGCLCLQCGEWLVPSDVHTEHTINAGIFREGISLPLWVLLKKTCWRNCDWMMNRTWQPGKEQSIPGKGEYFRKSRWTVVGT